MAKKRKKRRSLLSALLDGLLTLIDWLCEGIAGAAMGLLRAGWLLIAALVRGDQFYMMLCSALLCAVALCKLVAWHVYNRKM